MYQDYSYFDDESKSSETFTDNWSSANNYSSVSSRGRKPNIDREILKLFKNLRKENIRSKMIRGHKKLLAHIISNPEILTPERAPKSTHIQICEDSELATYSYFKIKQLYFENFEIFDKILSRKGKKKKGARGTEKLKERTYNNSYCKEYFKYDVLRESYFYYIKLVFFVIDDKILSENLSIEIDEVHTGMMMDLIGDVKTEIWKLLKEYLIYNIIEDLNLHPYIDQEYERFNIQEFLEKYNNSLF